MASPPGPPDVQAIASVLQTLFGTSVSMLTRSDVQLQYNSTPESPKKDLAGFHSDAVGRLETGEFTLTFIKLRHAEITTNLMHAIPEIKSLVKRKSEKDKAKRQLGKTQRERQHLERHPLRGENAELRRMVTSANIEKRIETLGERIDNITVHKKALRLYLPVAIKWKAQLYKCYDLEEYTTWSHAEYSSEKAKEDAKKLINFSLRWLFIEILPTYGSGHLNEYTEAGTFTLKFFVGNAVLPDGKDGRVITIAWSIMTQGFKNISKGFTRHGTIEAYPSLDLKVFTVRGDETTKNYFPQVKGGRVFPDVVEERRQYHAIDPSDPGGEVESRSYMLPKKREKIPATKSRRQRFESKNKGPDEKN
jgi:hypothetical protein